MKTLMTAAGVALMMLASGCTPETAADFESDNDGLLGEPEGVTLDAMRTGRDADESN